MLFFWLTLHGSMRNLAILTALTGFFAACLYPYTLQPLKARHGLYNGIHGDLVFSGPQLAADYAQRYKNAFWRVFPEVLSRHNFATVWHDNGNP